MSFRLGGSMAQRVQIILEDDYDGSTPTRRSPSHSTARSTKSTFRPRMRQCSETRWRRGWIMPARPAAGGGARRRRRARRAPAASGLGTGPGLDDQRRGRVSAEVREQGYERGVACRRLSANLPLRSIHLRRSPLLPWRTARPGRSPFPTTRAVSSLAAHMRRATIAVGAGNIQLDGCCESLVCTRRRA